MVVLNTHTMGCLPDKGSTYVRTKGTKYKKEYFYQNKGWVINIMIKLLLGYLYSVEKCLCSSIDSPPSSSFLLMSDST